MPRLAPEAKVTTPIGSSEDRAYSVAVQSDGKILVAGSSKNAGGVTVSWIFSSNSST